MGIAKMNRKIWRCVLHAVEGKFAIPAIRTIAVIDSLLVAENTARLMLLAIPRLNEDPRSCG
jgi:hypothetical protein